MEKSVKSDFFYGKPAPEFALAGEYLYLLLVSGGGECTKKVDQLNFFAKRIK